jgi:FKBP12-rapamycin complex-associated protein
MKADSPDRSFYRAILAVHQNQFPKALAQIAKARDLLDPELTSFVGESYGRSYKCVLRFRFIVKFRLIRYSIMVRAQMLSELEEIIAYKQYADQPERQQTMRKTWMKRFVSIPRLIDAADIALVCKVVNQTSKFGNGFFRCEPWY